MTDSGVHGVRELLERAVAAGQFPGAIALWGRAGGARKCCAVGRADIRTTARDVSSETWFDLASLTKPLVTNTLSLMAFGSGVLAPTTRVGEVLREVRNSPVGDLELRRLLTHTSGLPAWLPLYCLAEGRREKLVQVLGRMGIESRPGSRVVYSCVGFIIIGMVLAEVAGIDLDVLFRRQVLGPTGLENELGFTPDPQLRPVAGGATWPLAEERLVVESGLDPKWIPPVGEALPDDGNARFLGGSAGNAGLFGTARGVRRLVAEYSGGGVGLLTAQQVEQAVTSHTLNLEQERGYGWQISTTTGCSAGPALPTAAFGHTGFTGVSVWAEPARGCSWVLLTNRNHPGQRDIDLNPVRRRFHALADC